MTSPAPSAPSPNLPSETIALILQYHVHSCTLHRSNNHHALLTSSHLLSSLTLPLLYSRITLTSPAQLLALFLDAPPALLRHTKSIRFTDFTLPGYRAEEVEQALEIRRARDRIASYGHVPPTHVFGDQMAVYSKILPSLEEWVVDYSALGPDHFQSLLDIIQPHTLSWNTQPPLPTLAWDEGSRPFPTPGFTLTGHFGSGGWPTSLRFLQVFKYTGSLFNFPFEMFRGRRGPYDTSPPGAFLTRLDGVQRVEITLIEPEGFRIAQPGAVGYHYPSKYEEVLDREMSVLCTLVEEVRVNMYLVPEGARGVVRKWAEGKEGVRVGVEQQGEELLKGHNRV